MKIYSVIDISGSLTAEPITVTASSPKDAVAKAGYSDIRRDTANKGNIVVNGRYVYFATKRN